MGCLGGGPEFSSWDSHQVTHSCLELQRQRSLHLGNKAQNDRKEHLMLSLRTVSWNPRHPIPSHPGHKSFLGTFFHTIYSSHPYPLSSHRRDQIEYQSDYPYSHCVVTISQCPHHAPFLDTDWWCHIFPRRKNMLQKHCERKGSNLYDVYYSILL